MSDGKLTQMKIFIDQDSVNEPKTKSINYNFQNMKFFLYCWVISHEGLEQYAQVGGNCSPEGLRLVQTIYHSSYLMFIVNTMFLVYAYIRVRFVRMSFFLNITMNLTYNISIVGMCLGLILGESFECVSLSLVFKSIIFLTIKKEVECWIVLRMPLDMAARQANLASNFLFPFLLLTSGDLDECSRHTSQRIRFLILFGHSFVSIFGTLMNVLLHYLASKQHHNLLGNVRRNFKFTIILCTACMLLIYFIVIEFHGTKTITSRAPICLPLLYTLEIYPKINILSIMSMILLYFSEDEDLILQIKKYLIDTYTQLYSNNNRIQTEEQFEIQYSQDSLQLEDIQQPYLTAPSQNNPQEESKPKGILFEPEFQAFNSQYHQQNIQNNLSPQPLSLHSQYGSLSPEKINLFQKK